MGIIKEFHEFVGHTIANIERSHDELIFTLSDGEKYKLYHDQDCCESVWLEDVTGEFDDLIGSPILKADEVTNSQDDPEGAEVEHKEWRDSFTWTFYHIVTFKGESNGYYSESVDLAYWQNGRWIKTDYI